MIERTLTGPKPKHPLPAGTIDTQMHAYMPGFPVVEGGPAVPSGTPGPAEYRQVMEWLGIDRLVVTQGNAHQLDLVMEWVPDEATRQKLFVDNPADLFDF